MSEGHGDPPADVRSFLPRPGEPVEEYAERLRALHRDLTLVLQAVERGLAAAADADAPLPGEPGDVPPPGRPIDIVPIAPGDQPDPGRPPAGGRRERPGAPRVEVIPPPAGDERRFHPTEERRTVEPSAEAPAPPEEPVDERVPRPTPPFPARPSVASGPAPAREPEWVEREESFTPPTFPAGAPAATGQRLAVSPLVAGAFVGAWLVVVALLVALLVS